MKHTEAVLIAVLVLCAVAGLGPGARAAPPVPPAASSAAYGALDVNGDAVVNLLDLVTVSAAYGSSSHAADVNADGVVDLLDLVAVCAAYGMGAQTASKPVPSTPTATMLPSPPRAAAQPTLRPTAAAASPNPAAMPAAPPASHPDPWCVSMRLYLAGLEQDHQTRISKLVASRDARGILDEMAWYNRIHGEALALYNQGCAQ